MAGMNATPNDDRRLFERFYLLRALYSRRGEQDRSGVISIQEMLHIAEQLLTEETRTPVSWPSTTN